jgi:predicted metal-dependent hydrolase
MTTETTALSIRGISVQVVRKPIKNLHLGVHPPDGRVRVAAPRALTDAAIRVAIITRLTWIRRQREAFAKQARQSPREFVAGESHYFMGRRYRMKVVELTSGKTGMVLRGKSTLELQCRAGADEAARERVIERWYREHLRALAAPLIAKWEQKLGVRVGAWGVKRMKTKWGSCNSSARRIWLNLELAKKSPDCIEYLVVHELAHLLVRTHDERFTALMDRHLPRWKQLRRALNAAPLAHEEWEY